MPELPKDAFLLTDRHLVEKRESPRERKDERAWSYSKEKGFAPLSGASALEDDESFKIGAAVRHNSYGQGRVLSISGSGRLAKAQVRFHNDCSLRTIMMSHLQGLD